MWKLRDMERQTSSTRDSQHRWTSRFKSIFPFLFQETSQIQPGPWCLCFVLRSSMHCDRYMNVSERSTHSRLGESDDQEARYWTRKLYEFEANDPDRYNRSSCSDKFANSNSNQALCLVSNSLFYPCRWGHSGFKELYPEEFQSER